MKPRKLVQWAVAYVAFAFALIQVLDVVSDSYGWPRTAMHVVFGLLVLGFVLHRKNIAATGRFYNGALDGLPARVANCAHRHHEAYSMITCGKHATR